MKNHVVYGAGYGYTRADFEDIVLIQYDEIPRPVYSIQFKNLNKLDARFKIGLTGTPIVNSPIDAYAPLKWIEVENYFFFQ